MLKSKSFTAKNKRGNVVKVVKEHYLRDDIYCGVEGCTVCKNVKLSLVQEAMISSAAPTQRHLLIVDTNVVYQQIDLLCSPLIHDVVILQTVAEELRGKSMPVFTKLKGLLETPERRFFLFSNEHNRDTFVDKLPSETINDRNDRAIRVASNWYKQHLLKFTKSLTVILVTDDQKCRKLALEEFGLHAMSVNQYVESLPTHLELADLVVSAREHNETLQSRDVEAQFEEYLKPAQLQLGLKSGRFLQGSLTISNYNAQQGSIYTTFEGEMQAIQVRGHANLNRAINGDHVAIELLPKDQWPSVTEDDVAADCDSDRGDASDKLSVADKSKSGSDAANGKAVGIIPCAKVVGIVKRNWRPYCGALDPKSVNNSVLDGNMQSVLFIAIDNKIPRIRMRTRQARELLSQRIVVSIDTWDRSQRFPQGHFVRTLGSMGDRATETDVLLLEHDVSYTPFTKQVLADLPSEGDSWIVRPEHLENREDLRHELICSIDPPGCTDIDDALHARELPNGNIEVGVHIADVTNFVKPHTPMDVEAAKRGTTVYLVDKRIDMLPSLLGTNLCSLRSDVERLAFSCIWELTSDAQQVSVRFCKSVISSKASLTYEAAQARIDDISDNSDLTRGIRLLNELAKKLRQRRIEAGALTLASPEVRFRLENDSQDPVDLEMKELKETNALVEEFMLLANISVAKAIYKVFPDSAMLRRHPSPPVLNFAPLIMACGKLGIEIDVSSSKALADSLDRAELHPRCQKDPYFGKLLRIMTTRCMMQAVYFSSGSVSPSDFWHYGLATDIYTHFTSPIRRYCDIVVHRQLAAVIGVASNYGRELTDKDLMGPVCENLNQRNRLAQQAGRASVELFTNLFFKDKILNEEAYVIRILQNGFVVLVPQYGIESLIHAEAPHFEHVASEHKLSAANGVTIELFDKVAVQISLKETGRGGLKSKLDMHLVEPFVDGFSVQPLPNASNSNKRKTLSS